MRRVLTLGSRSFLDRGFPSRSRNVTTSLLVGGDECKDNVEAPIYLSFGNSTLGSLLSNFLNTASHHEANSGVSEGAILNFLK